MKPTSPLPWTIFLDESVQADDGTTIAYDLNYSDDAEYLIHACNAYPKLVAVIQGFISVIPCDSATKLLKELGEL